MPVATKSCVPSIITAGDTVIISVGPDAAYPNTGWSMRLGISRNGNSLKVWVGAAATGGNLGFVVTLPGSDTTKLAAGPATWAYLFTETATGQRKTGRTGETLIAPDPTKQLPDSGAAKALKGCYVAINAIVSDPNAEVNFNGQSYRAQNLGDLFKARDRLQIIVDAELVALGVSRRGGAKLILARFR